MNPTNTTLDIELGGKKITLIFDMAAFKAFERETGKFYMNWLMGLVEKSQMTVLDLVREFGEDKPKKPTEAEVETYPTGDKPEEDELKQPEIIDQDVDIDPDAPKQAEVVNDEEWYSLKRREIGKARLAGLVGMTDLEAIVWATYHTAKKPPRWPLKIEEVGDLLDENAYLELVPQVIGAALKNVMSGKKKPEAEEKPARPTSPSLETISTSGGLTSGDLDGDVLASLTRK